MTLREHSAGTSCVMDDTPGGCLGDRSPFAPCNRLVSSVSPRADCRRWLCSNAHLEVDVPLSEHEQRLLEQIERALVDDDPKFASTVRTGDSRLKARRKLQFGIGLVVVGLAVLVIGALKFWPLGVLGFLLMFAGVVLGILNYKNATGAVQPGTASGPAGRPGPGRGRAAKAGRPPLKNRLEERFRRRYDQ